MNLISITDLSDGQRRQLRDIALRLRLLRAGNPPAFLRAMQCAHGFGAVDPTSERIDRQIEAFSRVLGRLEDGASCYEK